MKTLLRNIIAEILGALARAIVRKYRPRVLMVTGSVGKTSTKDATAVTLSEKLYLRASEKSYNSEFGVPLTIIGSKNPWSNPFRWLSVFEEALALIIFPNHYPKFLVLEVGADRPGDLKRILKIVSPDAVIVTHLPEVPVHVEAYASPQAVRNEEFAPAHALSPDAPLIISADDEHALSMSKSVRAKHTTFGFDEYADVCITNEGVYEENGEPAGMQAVFKTKEGEFSVVVKGALGRPQLYAPSAAFATALALGLTSAEALDGLKKYVPPPGRGRILKGIRGSTIIDDSYNASPASVYEGLKALCLLQKTKRRVAVLGDMLELGRYSSTEHERIGKLVASCADILITVGIRARAIAEAGKKAGMKEEAVLTFDTAKEAGAYLLKSVEGEDAVLVKGSQSVRTERIVRELLQNPDDQAQLVRQEKEWQLIK